MYFTATALLPCPPCCESLPQRLKIIQLIFPQVIDIHEPPQKHHMSREVLQFDPLCLNCSSCSSMSVSSDVTFSDSEYTSIGSAPLPLPLPMLPLPCCPCSCPSLRYLALQHSPLEPEPLLLTLLWLLLAACHAPPHVQCWDSGGCKAPWVAHCSQMKTFRMIMLVRASTRVFQLYAGLFPPFSPHAQS